MSTPTASVRWPLGWPLRALLVTVLALAAVSVAVAPASAHSGLTGSDPADGATVSTELDRVALTFTEAPLAGLDAGLVIRVQNAAGTDESTGAVAVEGTTMSKAVDLSPGAHVVLWRYVSPDGHPIEGRSTFTYDPPTPPSASAVPSASTAAADQEAAPTATPTATATATSDAVRPLGQEPLVWVVVAGVGLLAAAATIVAVRRRGSAAPSDADD